MKKILFISLLSILITQSTTELIGMKRDKEESDATDRVIDHYGQLVVKKTKYFGDALSNAVTAAQKGFQTIFVDLPLQIFNYRAPHNESTAIRCALLIDDFGDESIKNPKTWAIAHSLLLAMKESVDSIIVSHYVLENLLDRHYAVNSGRKDASGKEFKKVPDITEWQIFDVYNSQFYLFLHKKNFIANKSAITVPLSKKVKLSFPVFKTQGFNLRDINSRTLQQLYDYVKHEAVRKTGYKFDVKDMSEIFVTPEFALNSLVNPELSPDLLKIVYEHFSGEKSDKAAITRLTIIDYLRSVMPKYNFFINGHGCVGNASRGAAMAGISLDKIPDLLIFINKLNTKMAAISSCSAGGANLVEVVRNLKSKIKNWDKINYILAVLSTGDFESAVRPNFSNFFSQIESGKSDKKNVTSWFSKALKAVSLGQNYILYDIFWQGYITSLPQIMVPNVGWFSFVEMSDDIQIINAIRLQKKEEKIDIKNKMVTLLNVDVIPKNLSVTPHKNFFVDFIPSNLIKLFALSPFERIHGAPYNFYALNFFEFICDMYGGHIHDVHDDCFPAIVPACKGTDTYFIKSISAIASVHGNNGVLKFLRDSFILCAVKCAMHKKFCIASLTGLNDFKNLFSKGILDPVKNSDLYRCIANTSETLTLKNVYISIKGSEEIEIIFSLPLNDGKKVKFRLYFNGTAQENGKILSAPVIEGEKIENAWKFTLFIDWYALISAIIETGDINQIGEILSNNPGAVYDGTRTEFNKLTALHIASELGKVKVVEFLITKFPEIANIAVNNPKQDYHGWTPLHFAAYSGNVEVVDLLITRFPEIANIAVNNPGCGHHGWTPLQFATGFGNVEVAKLLITRFPEIANIAVNNPGTICHGYTPLCFASQGNKSSIVHLLMITGANPNIPLENPANKCHMFTPLHIAVEEGHTDVVKEIIESHPETVNAIINKPGDPYDGSTALHIAAKKGFEEIVDLLLAHRADPKILNAAYRDGAQINQTASEIAFENGHEKIGKKIRLKFFLQILAAATAPQT